MAKSVGENIQSRGESGFLLLCRAGFEADLAAEVTALVGEIFPTGYIKTKAQSGFVLFLIANAGSFSLTTVAFQKAVQRLRGAVFARQIQWVIGSATNLPEKSRAQPIAAAFMEKVTMQCAMLTELGLMSNLSNNTAQDMAIECAENEEAKGPRSQAIASAKPPFAIPFLLESPDTPAAKEILPFCKSFKPHLQNAVRLWISANIPAIDFSFATSPAMFFPNWLDVWFCLGIPGLSSSLPQGILRLRADAKSPSRSALKLEEAILTLLSAKQQAALTLGKRAVDLGASPGGWTHELVKRGMHVVAVDNGHLDEALLASGLVEHLQEDGFKFVPKKPVDWMVCDMVEQPRRIADLVASWATNGYAKQFIFNLKLPMKARYQEMANCREKIFAALDKCNHKYFWKAKHLYHDREEVTCYLHVHGASLGD